MFTGLVQRMKLELPDGTETGQGEERGLSNVAVSGVQHLAVKETLQPADLQSSPPPSTLRWGGDAVEASHP